MEYEKIKTIMEDMSKSNLTLLEINFPDGTRVNMKKEEKEIIIQNQENIQQENSKSISYSKKEECNIEEGKIIKSPMVGTFYLKPSPTSEPYVEIGKDVKKGNIVCIIEAMKLMNEIESEFDGKIEEIFVQDGEPVEFGKPLFKLK